MPRSSGVYLCAVRVRADVAKQAQEGAVGLVLRGGDGRAGDRVGQVVMKPRRVRDLVFAARADPALELQQLGLEVRGVGQRDTAAGQQG